VKCPECGRVFDNDPGGSYDRQLCEAADLRERLRRAEAAGEEPDKLRELRRRIEQADYVGD